MSDERITRFYALTNEYGSKLAENTKVINVTWLFSGNAFLHLYSCRHKHTGSVGLACSTSFRSIRQFDRRL